MAWLACLELALGCAGVGSLAALCSHPAPSFVLVCACACSAAVLLSLGAVDGCAAMRPPRVRARLRVVVLVLSRCGACGG
jgi:hypothetical protein